MVEASPVRAVIVDPHFWVHRSAILNLYFGVGTSGAYAVEGDSLCWFCNNLHSSVVCLLFKRPFRILANACDDPNPNFPIGVKVIQMDAETLELEKDWVGSSIGLDSEAQTNWELQMSHDDAYIFPRQEHHSTGKRTRWNNLEVKGTEAKILSELVPVFSASGCTTLFVHACTTNVQLK